LVRVRKPVPYCLAWVNQNRELGSENLAPTVLPGLIRTES
jgi:hypothetical protein